MVLHHVLDGDPAGPTVIMHGSLACASRLWEPQLAALTSAGLRVVRYDYPGHGRSPIRPGPRDLADYGADVLRLMEQRGLGSAVHVGLSLGGMVAMWLAEHEPSAVDGLVLCATSARLEPRAAWAERAVAVRAAGSTADIAAAFLPRWLSADFRAARPAVAAWVRDQILETTAEGFAAGCEAIATMDLDHDLHRIAVPTAVIVGGQDPGTPPDHAQRIAEAVPGATLTIVDRGAHLINVEAAGAVTRSITTLVEAVTAARP